MRMRFALLAGAAALALSSGSALAETAPSNQELFKMLQQQQQTINELRNELRETKQELRAARQMIRRDLDANKAAVEKARKAVDDSAKVMATRTDLERTKAELGTQPTRSVATIPSPGGWFAFGGPIFLRPSHELLDYVTVNPVPNPSDSEQAFGPLRSVSPGFATGGRVGFGWAEPGTGWDAKATFTFLSHSKSDSVSEPPGGKLSITRMPDELNEDDADVASARYQFNTFVLDVEAGQKLQLGDRTSLRLFAGLRYANVNQKMDISYVGEDCAGGIFPDCRVEEHNKFWGIGPRVGANIQWTQLRQRSYRYFDLSAGCEACSRS